MKKNIILISLFIFIVSTNFGFSWWGTGDALFNAHSRFSRKSLGCYPLPVPKNNRCSRGIDLYELFEALDKGSSDPDIEAMTNRSEWTKHSFNFEWNSSQNSTIRMCYSLSPQSFINAGLLFGAIHKEEVKIKDICSNLGCSSSFIEYLKLWNHFGRVSHFASDLSVPMHSYSVAASELQSNWRNLKGNFTFPVVCEGISMTCHSFLEEYMYLVSDIDGIGCPGLAPEVVGFNARGSLKGYRSITEEQGYSGLYVDCLWFPRTPVDLIYFYGVGKKQINDAIASINWHWKNMLELDCSSKSEQELSTCNELNKCECGSAECPTPSNPDDNASNGYFTELPGNNELLRKAWNRIAAKKSKQSLISNWIQRYLFGELAAGNMSEDAYKQIAEKYDTQGDLEEELFYDDYIATPDVAILSKGMALSFSDLLQNRFNEPIRRYTIEDFSPDAIKDYPIFIIPTGGLTGLENSEIFKEKLSQYVNRGGIVIVFDQQYGYEFSALPVPQEFDGSYKKLNGYGWEEDQACFTNAAYLNVYHQIFSGQTQTIPSLNIDG